MHPHYVVTLTFGCLALATAWLPSVLRQAPITLPIVAVAVGAAIHMAAGSPDLNSYRAGWETLTEYVLVIAVMGAGLKIDRAFRWWAWRSTWLLLLVAMPVSIGLTALAGWGIIGLPIGLSLLVAAILSPTDPVLASDVQVGPPGEGEVGEVRFALTSEAGLNDGIAMPFVLLAIGLQNGKLGSVGSIIEWLSIDLVWHVILGAGLGAAFGWALVTLDHRLPERFRLGTSGDGLAVLGVSLVVYGLAEIAGANGFVAVFSAAVASRNASPQHFEFARALHGFADQLERLAMVVLMALFGALLMGGLLLRLQLTDIIFVGTILFIVRPAATALACIGSGLPLSTRAALGYFGIRGLGSLFYLFFALSRTDIDDPDRLQATVALTILVSVTVYGLSASTIMKFVDARRKREGAVYRGPVLGSRSTTSSSISSETEIRSSEAT